MTSIAVNIGDPPGTGVICETWALQVTVIPAKAGIHSASLRKCAVYELDSRFRGNDQRFANLALQCSTLARQAVTAPP